MNQLRPFGKVGRTFALVLRINILHLAASGHKSIVLHHLGSQSCQVLGYSFNMASEIAELKKVVEDLRKEVTRLSGKGFIY